MPVAAASTAAPSGLGREGFVIAGGRYLSRAKRARKRGRLLEVKRAGLLLHRLLHLLHANCLLRLPLPGGLLLLLQGVQLVRAARKARRCGRSHRFGGAQRSKTGRGHRVQRGRGRGRGAGVVLQRQGLAAEAGATAAASSGVAAARACGGVQNA